MKGWFPGREQLMMQMMQFMAMTQGGPPPGAPVNQLPANSMGGAAAPQPMPQSPVEAGSEIEDDEPAGRDFVSGQNTSQPDETMMEV